MVAAVVLALLAGVVRGFTGFGYAVIVVLGLNLLMAPQAALATAILLDLACCLGLLRQAAVQAHRPLLARLVIGMVLALPLGLWAIRWLPAGIMSQLVGGISLLGEYCCLLDRPLPQLAHALCHQRGSCFGSGNDHRLGRWATADALSAESAVACGGAARRPPSCFLRCAVPSLLS